MGSRWGPGEAAGGCGQGGLEAGYDVSVVLSDAWLGRCPGKCTLWVCFVRGAPMGQEGTFGIVAIRGSGAVLGSSMAFSLQGEFGTGHVLGYSDGSLGVGGSTQVGAWALGGD